MKESFGYCLMPPVSSTWKYILMGQIIPGYLGRFNMERSTQKSGIRVFEWCPTLFNKVLFFKYFLRNVDKVIKSNTLSTSFTRATWLFSFFCWDCVYCVIFFRRCVQLFPFFVTSHHISTLPFWLSCNREFFWNHILSFWREPLIGQPTKSQPRLFLPSNLCTSFFLKKNENLFTF